jgi:hypothetical protein
VRALWRWEQCEKTAAYFQAAVFLLRSDLNGRKHLKIVMKAWRNRFRVNRLEQSRTRQRERPKISMIMILFMMCYFAVLLSSVLVPLLEEFQFLTWFVICCYRYTSYNGLHLLSFNLKYSPALFANLKSRGIVISIDICKPSFLWMVGHRHW